MLQQFKISIFRLTEPQSRILLAVSGGMDSVLLCHLCNEAGINFAIAHCNFQLRGEASDGDERMVKELAEQLSVPFYSKRFETEVQQKEQGGSIQMLARELRYTWFEALKEKERFDYLATAHHLDDSMETVLYNLAKGTGLRGLTGVPEKRDWIIRPMLNFSKEEIRNYIIKNKIEYREDASNAGDKYARNKIRHHVLPILREINPSLEKTFLQTLGNLNDSQVLLEEYITTIFEDILHEKDAVFYLNKDKLKNYSRPKTILFEWLKDYGFNTAQMNDVLVMMQNNPGGKILSPSHRLVNDREYLLLDEIEVTSQEEIIIDQEEQFFIANNVKWEFSIVGKSTWEKINVLQINSHAFDASKITFPLVLRKRQAGDYFYPLGMKGKKKLKKYFIDQKYSIPKKEQTCLLVCKGEIAAILGDRIDDRFKVTNATEKVLVLRVF